jgi:hypothetical protein
LQDGSEACRRLVSRTPRAGRKVLYGSAPAMLRPRPLASVIAALALVACVLLFAPIGATQSASPTLSPTPPVTLTPVPTTPVSTTTTGTTTTSGPPDQLPRTGLDAWLVVLIGLGLLATGAALRRELAGLAPRRSG